MARSKYKVASSTNGPFQNDLPVSPYSILCLTRFLPLPHFVRSEDIGISIRAVIIIQVVDSIQIRAIDIFVAFTITEKSARDISGMSRTS